MNDTEHAAVLRANVEYHTALAAEYDVRQPHFRPENVVRVDELLRALRQRAGMPERATLLDLGTGTGFVLNIAKRHFERVLGVDLTPAMLAQVDTTGGEVTLHTSSTESMPFIADGSVHVVTAYTFLHHLFDLRPTLTEAYRCLASGGVFYSDQDPNMWFWHLMHELNDVADLPATVAREVRSVTEVAEDVAAEAGISSEMVELAEFQKVRKGGLNPEGVAALMREIGFRNVEIRYEWYLGEGDALRTHGAEAQAVAGRQLRAILPASRSLFKYVAFTAEK